MKTPHHILAAVFLAAISLQAFSLSLLADSGGANAGIELGIQTYTFRDRTFAEVLDRAAAMKIKHIQAFARQKISPTNSTIFNHHMDAASKAEVRALLKAKGVTLSSYGNIMGKDEAEWRKIFDFAKEMGVQNITSEPQLADFPLVDKLSREYGIPVTIHNHPPPNRFGSPEAVFAAIKPYGKHIGFCADTGHWARAGLDPVANLRKYADRLISLHLKDISEFGVRTAHDMPWGAGACSLAQQIAELRRQNFRGVVYMEYEINVPAPRLEAEAAASADWFHRAVAAPLDDLIAGRVLPAGYVSEKDIAQTWTDKKRNAASARWPAAKPLFTENLSNATFKPGTWEYKDGVLTAKGVAGAPKGKGWQGGVANIWTNETYGDFVLNLDFRCAEKTNSGVLIRVGDIAAWLHTGMEIQILQGDTPDDKHLVGALYDVSAPTRPVDIKPGQWYHLTIIAKGQSIKVSVDGEEVTNVDLGKWTEAGQNPDGSKNKFKTAYAQMPKKGQIGLQYHGTPIAFRNMVIETQP